MYDIVFFSLTMTITESTSVISITAATHFPIKLTASNFPVWKCQVHNALVGLGLDSYIDGTLLSPNQFTDPAKTQTNPCYTIWYRQDKTIISALIGSCSETIQPLISSAITARQAWEKLTLTYASTSRGRIISLKTQMARTTKGARPILAYLAEMHAFAESLALAQSPVTDEDLVIGILNGLGSEYNDILSAVRVRETPLPLSQLQDILLEQEKRHNEQVAATHSLLPTANATQMLPRGPQPERRYHGDSRPSSSRRGRGSYQGHANRSSNGPVCRFCDNVGHEVKYCRKLQRFIRDNNISIATSPAVHNTMTSAAPGGQPWLFDTGASHHVTSDAANLPTYTDYGGPDEVKLGDGSDHGGVTHARGEPS
ncbi:unnamed protein product [Cuscuta epithymum]|uniref:Retrotransposon Copia-like N-terminal domain-containing protein n=1 Tax=Cuscuta epithymum TaxID=186058 RepID=A0AAV0F8Y1_9ASTE|nr:unnamed protein product [Cuscuta epithymum]